MTMTAGYARPDSLVVVHCAGGYRSSMAVSLLQNHGLEDLVELIGGMAAWEAAKLHVEGVSVEAAVA